MTFEGVPLATPLVPYFEERERLIADGWDDDAPWRLADLMSDAVVELAGDLPPATSLVAIGGFGRRVMAIHSDVDLLFLGDDPGVLEPRILRPLWDARIKVGHQSHTPASARTFAASRLDAISTLLTSRLLAGDEAVYNSFWVRYGRLLDKEHAQIVRMMANEEIERRKREPYRLMAANVKSDRGGIRTLDLIDWRRRLFEASGAGWSIGDIDTRIRIGLTRFRCALHVAAGRAHDEYDLELRERVAAWLETDVLEAGRQLLELRTQSEWLVDQAWPNLRQGDPPSELSSLLDVSSPSDRDRFHQLDAGGHIESHFPDWRRLRDLPHIVAFHRYPVGDHTLAAVDEAAALLDRPSDPVIREAVAGLEEPTRLLWAAWLHDVGKGLEGDHARAGADRVPDLCASLGIEDTELYQRLVQHHLLLADLATRYDLDDPAVLSWAADRIFDMETLRLLFLLTVADSRATGTDTWSTWRAELVRRAYRRMERELMSRSLPDDAQIAVLADRVVAASNGALDREDVVSHLTGFGEVYRTGHAPDEIWQHIEIARTPLGPGRLLTRVIPGDPGRVMVLATDRPRLLLAVAGVVALARFSIVDARLATRSDGLVFDTFDVVRTDGQPISQSQADQLAIALEESLRLGFSHEADLASKQHAYRSTGTRGIPAEVDVRHLPDGDGEVAFECSDRIGLLFDIATVLDRWGMPISRARMDTRAGVAYSRLHVRRVPIPSEPLRDELLAAIEQRPAPAR